MKHIFLSIKKWLKDTRHLEEGTTERSSTDVTSGRNKNTIARFLHALRLVGMTPFVILSRKAKNPVTLAVSILGFFIAILAIIYIGNRMGLF